MNITVDVCVDVDVFKLPFYDVSIKLSRLHIQFVMMTGCAERALIFILFINLLGH